MVPSSKFNWSAVNNCHPTISQVGPLCTFSEDDLEPHISCILDPGCDVVFVWHGSRASTKMRVRYAVLLLRSKRLFFFFFYFKLVPLQ